MSKQPMSLYVLNTGTTTAAGTDLWGHEPFTIKDAHGHIVAVAKDARTANALAHASNSVPDLLAALKDLVDVAEGCYPFTGSDPNHDLIERARAAIAKAENS